MQLLYKVIYHLPPNGPKTGASPSIKKKCYLMRFNIKSPLYFNYLIEDTVIVNKSSIKDLEVLISSYLTWNLHVSYIIGKAYRSLGLLRHTFSHCNSVSAKKKLYITLVKYIITYASPLWHPHLKKEFVLLEKIQ